jgi:two-component system, NarL family, response regulator NreC
VELRTVARRTANRKRPGAIDSPTSPLHDVAARASQGRYVRRGVPVANDIIRVLLVDDHAILRDGLRALLRSAPDIQVVGEAANGSDAISAVQRSAPDVVLMDLDMPGIDGTTATREIAALDPAPKVLILTMHTEEERLVPLLKDGARGFLSKDCAERDLIDAIRVVASGEFYVRPNVARILAANAMPRHQESSIDDDRRKLELLSARERSVLQRVAEGYSGVEIARMLDITPKTVDTYKTRIGQKLGFTHRTDYVRFALRLGLIGDAISQRNADEESNLR